MIFVSTSSIKEKKLSLVLDKLIKNNIKNIELSGGTVYDLNLEREILNYAKKYKVNFRLHNYFPPPKKNFIINIASLNTNIYKKSIKHCIKAIELSKKLNSDLYGCHAGFLIDPQNKEIGKKIKKKIFFDRNKSINQMVNAWKILNKYAKGKVKLYLENNVLSNSNYKSFNSNPFFLTDKKSYLKLKKYFDFNVLLDLAHLKVSCQTLKLEFENEAEFFFNKTDYIHLSGNNGVEDTNNSILSDNKIINFLKKKDLSKKTFTLEVYSDIDKIIKDLIFLKRLINKNKS